MATKLLSKAGLFGAALAVTGALGIMDQASATPKETQVWREAFQSSPAHYDPLAPEFVKMLVEKFKMPPAAVEQMRPQTASGTQRIRLAVSARGPQIRIRVSNEEGTEPLVLTAASVGLAGAGYVSKPGTLKSVTFGGRRSVTAGGPDRRLSTDHRPRSRARRPGHHGDHHAVRFGS